MSKPKIIPQPTTELGELLGTEDRGQHPARARELVQMAQAPVLTIVIQHDPRGGRTTVNVTDSQGNPVAFATAHRPAVSKLISRAEQALGANVSDADVARALRA